MENKERTKTEQNLEKIRELMGGKAWKNTGIYGILQTLEEKGLTDGVTEQLKECVKSGALYRWFEAHNRNGSGAYETDPAFVEARILEYFVNERNLSPKMAEQLIPYIRVIGGAVTKGNVTNLDAAPEKAERKEYEISGGQGSKETGREIVERRHRGTGRQKKAMVIAGICGAAAAGCVAGIILYAVKKR